MGNISNQLITLIIGVLLARFFGPEKLGTYYLLITIPIILNSFTSLGHIQGLNRFLPELRGTNKLYLIPKLLRHVLTVRLFIIVIAATLFIVFDQKIFSLMGLRNFQKPIVIFYLLTYFILMNFNSVMNVLLIVNMKQRKLNILDVFLTIIKLVVILILIQFNWLQITRMVAILLGFEVIKFIYLLCNYSVPSNTLKESYIPEYQELVHRFSKYSIIMYLIQLSGMILAYRSDIYFIGYFMTGSAVAFYVIASNLTTQAYGLIGTSSMGQLFLSAMVESYKRHGESSLKNHFRYQTSFVALHSVPVLIGGLILSPSVVQVLYGTDYLPLVNPLLVLLCIHFVLKFGGVASAVLSALEKPHYFLWTKLGVFLNITLNILLIPIYGILGAVLATGITKILIMLLEVVLTRRLIAITLPAVKILVIGLLGLVMGFIMIGVGFLIPNIYLRICIQFITGIFTYLLLIIRLKVIDQEIIDLLPDKMRSIINKLTS